MAKTDSRSGTDAPSNAKAKRVLLETIPITLIRNYEKNAQAIGDRLRAVIKERHPNETYESLGEQLGISKSAFSHKMKGRSPLGLIEAVALAQHLGENLMEIINPVVDPKSLQTGSVFQGFPPSNLTERNLLSAWQVAKNEYPMASEDEKFQMALWAAAHARSPEALNDDLSSSIKTYLLEKLRSAR